MNATNTWDALWGISNYVQKSFDMFLIEQAVTWVSLFWLVYRASLTLRKPINELIGILGVEVPDAPEVSLAGIKSDAITLQWRRPEPNKPVVKYLIQVNGVNVGESQRNETAITVTGLKPAHFYNVRVISVGANNFQAGSSVIRLRTYGKDRRPILDNGRVPSNFCPEEPKVESDISDDEAASGRGHSAGIETAALPDGSQGLRREPAGYQGQRRNTGGRKHSSSTPPSDQISAIVPGEPEESMQQLTEKFEAIRKETDETIAQVAKDVEDFRSQMHDILKEKDEKKVTLKEKEDASEKLKKEVHLAERANRLAQNRKSAKEKLLKDKQTEKAKMRDDLARWRREIDDMKVERENWKEDKDRFDREKEDHSDTLRETIRQQQNSLNGLEEEIRVKGLQMKELEEARQHLPGAQDDDESRARDIAQGQRDAEWEIKEKSLVEELNRQALMLRHLEAEFHSQTALFNALSARQVSNPIMYHGNSSGVDFDPSGNQRKAKSRRTRNRKSRTSTISSPIAGFPIADSQFPSASAYNNLNSSPNAGTFAAGLHFDFGNDTHFVPISDQIGMSEADIRALTADAPLSPTATALLPSNIFADDDPPSPRANSPRSFGPALYNSIGKPVYDNDPQSPSSSSRSASLVSSPRSSGNNLAMYGVSSRDYGQDMDRRSLNSPRAAFRNLALEAGSDQPASNKGFSMFNFPRARGKTLQDGPALGTLKQGQSQSFPRSADDPEPASSKPRRISFSTSWSVMPSFLSRSSTAADVAEGNAPAPARNVGARRRRGFNVFNSSIDDPNAYSDRNPSSPRPVSIASSDLPRPSTDSAPFGWPAGDGLLNRNSPLATNWSINATQSWSRNPSRRPSIQHGSAAALASGVASEDDEFLPSDTLTTQTSPPPVGVIGVIGEKRPESSSSRMTGHSAVAKLNPNAPSFKGMFNFASKTDKDKSKAKGKEKIIELPSSSDGPSRPTTSPSESRKSRDTHSIHTQYSVTESHESLNLETTSSNTPSEMTNPSATSGKEKTFRGLLRKGSSSKFSLPAGIFGGKKGPSSATNSDRNASGERDSSFDEFGEEATLGRSVESITSSPLFGSHSQAGTLKEGRISVNWGRFIGKGKGRESMDVERSDAELAETEDEGYS